MLIIANPHFFVKIFLCGPFALYRLSDFTCQPHERNAVRFPSFITNFHMEFQSFPILTDGARNQAVFDNGRIFIDNVPGNQKSKKKFYKKNRL